MKILLSPSETKIFPQTSNTNSINTDKMWGGFQARICHAQNYLKKLQTSPDTELQKIFGKKNIPLDYLSLAQQLFSSPTIEAIKLYNGVAFKALEFATLTPKQQDFILENVCIFSNLFGMVRAKDLLPYYHLNQNYSSDELSLKLIYAKQKDDIDSFLQDEEIIDLRAGIYIKAYPINAPHWILKLPKNSSHQAKLHRGLALRQLAQEQKIDSEKFVLSH